MRIFRALGPDFDVLTLFFTKMVFSQPAATLSVVVTQAGESVGERLCRRPPEVLMFCNERILCPRVCMHHTFVAERPSQRIPGLRVCMHHTSRV